MGLRWLPRLLLGFAKASALGFAKASALAVASASALAVASSSALAGGFSVLPTRVQLGSDRGVQSVLLTNTSSQTVTVESQVLVWPEGAGGQQASDVVVTPAVLTLPPGQRMRVRIGLLRAGDGKAERAYRLYFTELPAPAPLQAAGIGVRLRIGIPIFVVPQQANPQSLRWQLQPGGTGLEIEAHNPGNVHARIADARLVDGTDAAALTLASPYVLAGARVRLPMPTALANPPTAASALRVRWMDGDDARDGALAAP